MNYNYVDSRTPLKKIDYSYSKYYGEDFIRTWRMSRQEFLGRDSSVILDVNSNVNPPIFNEKNFIDVDDILDYWIAELVANRTFDHTQLWLLLKRFEVTKKIYNDYSAMMRPSSKENLAPLNAFAKWGVVLGLFYENQSKYQILNALIKVNDILISHPTQRNLLALCSVRKEIDLVDELIEKKFNANHE